MVDYPVQHITTHEPDALKRLLTQYSADRAPNLRSIITANADQWQQLEDAFWDLLTLRSIATGSGAQLDVIGKILGQPRGGASDATYKTLLYIRIAEINSQGTAEELIAIFSTLFSGAKVQYEDTYPAAFMMTALGGTPLIPVVQIATVINECKAAGVGFLGIWSPSLTPLVFQGDPDGLGLGGVTNTGRNVGLGGDLAGAIP